MSLNFHYRLQRVGRPVHSLGGRFVRPRPLVPVVLIGPQGSHFIDAKLDTAADDTIFPVRFAPLVGIDLTGATAGEAAGVTGIPIPVHYVQAELEISSGSETRRWPATIAFGKVANALLGFAGCLQFFTATFHGDQERVELTVNSLYPGS